MPGLMQQGVNRSQQKFGIDAVKRRLQGVSEPRGITGILSRGKNVYSNGTYAATSGGGPGFGRPVGSRDGDPRRAAINRRMAQQQRQSNRRMY